MSMLTRLRRGNKGLVPPIFADLVVEINGQPVFFDVEEPRWLEQGEVALRYASRAGLQLRGERAPRVWLRAGNGAGSLAYFSRVFGQFGEDGRCQTRLACLRNAVTHVWLYPDGAVEVGPTPALESFAEGQDGRFI